jgi:hypothetical protein
LPLSPELRPYDLSSPFSFFFAELTTGRQQPQKFLTSPPADCLNKKKRVVRQESRQAGGRSQFAAGTKRTTGSSATISVS